MKTSANGVAVLHHYESCKLTAYPDPATGNDPWTIGWGCTGPDISPGMVITQDEADARFAKRLAHEFEPGVSVILRMPVGQGQFDGCVSLAYNIGLSNFRSSTLVRKFNSGDIPGASLEFLRWSNAAGKSMLGLRRRRASERALFNGMNSYQAIAIGEAVQ